MSPQGNRDETPRPEMSVPTPPTASEPFSSLRPLSELPTVGETFDKYRLLAKLATGGMAELFVARLTGAAGFRKNVVIKRILPHVAHDPQFERMFLDEALTCAELSHPNVCQVFELCEAQGIHYLVLEHLEGATVGDLIRRSLVTEQQLQIPLALGIIVQACDGLHAAHELTDDSGRTVNLVHRDISPGNLFVTVDGMVKVLDFGIAKAKWMQRKTQTGTLLGKCEYMSPEQARGGVTLDRRSDIFSLGIIAWELLCGRRLFRRKNEYESLKAVLRAPIPSPRSLRPEIPEPLSEVIMKALERDRSDRYRSAQEFRRELAETSAMFGGPSPLCDIAPVIRGTFAEELGKRRAALKKAWSLCLAEDAARSAQEAGYELPKGRPVDDTGHPQMEWNTSSVTAPRKASGEILVEEARQNEPHELTLKMLPKQSPGRTMQPSSLPLPSSRAAEGSNSGPMPAAPSDAVPRAITAAESSRALSALAEHRAQERARGQVRMLASIATVLALALAAGVGGYLYFSSNNPAGPLTRAPGKETSATESAAPPKATAARSAADNAIHTRNRLRALEEQHEAPVVNGQDPGRPTAEALGVGSPLPATTGSLSIHSSQPATLLLYPERRIVGTTPIEGLSLPPGKHKLRATLADGQRKYFTVFIEAGKSSTRRLDHWK